jgi:hypothetical protein
VTELNGELTVLREGTTTAGSPLVCAEFVLTTLPTSQLKCRIGFLHHKVPSWMQYDAPFTKLDGAAVADLPTYKA